GRERALFLHLTLVPYIAAAGELKTKPTQHSVKELQSVGIHPDILLCRADREIPENERAKIALFCNLDQSAVIQALDVDSIYRVPLSYHEEGLDREVLRHFNLTSPEPDLSRWQEIVKRVTEPEGKVTIGVVGKYVNLLDAYKSLAEALTHGGIANNAKVEMRWIDSEIFEEEDPELHLSGVHGILVPGGFGERGSSGKIAAVRHARERQIPYFGICFGMQMAVLEMARNLAGIENAASSEFGATNQPVVGLMTEWERDGDIQRRSDDDDLGGTMRLGAYDCKLSAGTRVADIYGQEMISERHRHRYEVNPTYRAELEKAGVVFSGLSPDERLPEIIELPESEHPWFVGVQFHPELKSRPFEPHPLFVSFINAAVTQ
ncbi:MAG: CTP synthase, partial [Alphaproteobacteria bacterium]